MWKCVVGYEGFYEVSDEGAVRSIERIQTSYGGRSWIKKAKVLRPTFEGRYFVVTLAKNGTSTRPYLHSVVLEAFHGARPDGFHACHNDGNSKNNALSNLRWDTAQSNNQDKIKHKTIAEGTKHGMNKYSKLQVERVLFLLGEGNMNSTEIESETGVGRMTVLAIKSGRQWKSLQTISHR